MVNDSLDAVLQDDHVEVDEQAERESGDLQVGAHLRFVKRSQGFDRLEFEDQAPADDHVYAALANHFAFVEHIDTNLWLEWNAAPPLPSKEQEQGRLGPYAPRAVASSSATPYADTGKAIVYRDKTYEYSFGNVKDVSVYEEIINTIGQIEASKDSEEIEKLLESLDGYCE